MTFPRPKNIRLNIDSIFKPIIFTAMVNRRRHAPYYADNYCHTTDMVLPPLLLLSLLLFAVIVFVVVAAYFFFSSFSIKLSLTVMSHCFWYTSLAIRSMQCALIFVCTLCIDVWYSFIGIVISTQSFCNKCVNRFRVQYDRLYAANDYAYVILVMSVKIYMSVCQQQQQQYQTANNIKLNVRRRNEMHEKEKLGDIY